MKFIKEPYIWVLLRFGMGWIFLWAFLDKMFGLGYATPASKSVLSGASATYGFLKFGTGDIFGTPFQSLAGNPVVDFLFMLGLFSVGTALMLGIGIRIAGFAGILVMFLIWLAGFPPENNIFLDDHIIYILVLLGITNSKAGQILGFGRRWIQTPFVKKYKFLE